MGNIVVTIFASNIMMVLSAVLITVSTFNILSRLTDEWKVKKICMWGLGCGLFNGIAAVAVNTVVEIFLSILPLISVPVFLVNEIYLLTKEKNKYTYIFFYFCIAINYAAFYDMSSSIVHLINNANNNIFGIGSYTYRNVLFVTTNIITAFILYILSIAKHFPMEELKKLAHDMRKGILFFSYIMPVAVVLTITHVIFSPANGNTEQINAEFILYINAAMKTFIILSGAYLILFAEAYHERLLDKTVGLQEDLEAASRDALTNLYNRKTALEKISEQMDYKSPAVLFLLDLDKFKLVNDTLGHPAGDEVLKTTADSLQRYFRSHDIVCRLGGDEFMVYTPGLEDMSIVKKRAERLCEMLIQDVKVSDTESIKVTASVGIAAYPTDGGDVASLYNSADKALYSAKEAGRNTYRVFGEL